MANSVLLSVGINVISAIIHDFAKATLGTVPVPLRDALQTTVDEFPEIPGLEDALKRWMKAPVTAATLQRFIEGKIAGNSVPLEALSNALLDKSIGDLYLPDKGDKTAHRVIRQFITNLRERYLLEPTLAVRFIAERQETIGTEHSQRLADIHQSLLGIHEEVRISSGNAIDSQLDEITSLLEKRDYEAARYELRKLKKRWDSLDTRQRFRFLVQSGSICFSENDSAGALKFFREALAHPTGTEKYVEIEALTYLLAGDRDKAFETAESGREAFPGSPKLALVLAQTAPPEWSTKQVIESLTPTLLENVEVLTNLAFRALAEGNVPLAEDLSSRACTSGQWSSAHIVRGRTLALKGVSAVNTRALLVEAESEFAKAIQLAVEEKSTFLHAAALIDHGNAKRMLGEFDAAASDFKEAYRLNPDDLAVRSSYADHLSETGSRAQAIGILREAAAGLPVARLKLAELLSQGTMEEKREAAGLFAELALFARTDVLGATHAATRAVDTYIAVREFSDARAFLEKLGSGITAVTQLVFSARIKSALGDNAIAARDLQKAAGGVDEHTTKHELLLLGTALHESGNPADALPILDKVKSDSELTFATKMFLNCAGECGRDDLIFETCRNLRAAGLKSRELLLFEIDRLEQYDFDATVDLLQEALATDPDPVLRLRLSLMGVQRARYHLVDTDISRIPSPDEIDVKNGRAAVHVLKFGGRPNEALRYGYALLRKHFDDPDAHMAFMVNLHPFDPGPDIPRDIRVVGPETAVSFREEGDSHERWVVLEDTHPADPKLDEINRHHELWNELQGKGIGENFVIARTSFSERTATITSVMSKYVYRYQDCCSNWEFRFPGVSVIHSIRVSNGPGENFDFSAVLKSIDQQHESYQRMTELYRTKPVSLELFGRALGKNAMDTLQHFAITTGHAVMVCDGTLIERAAALQALASGLRIVLDLTGIATISLLKMEHLIQNWPGRIIVGQATYGELEEMLYQANLSLSREGGVFGKIGEQYTLVEIGENERLAHRNLLQNWIELLRTKCEIHSGLPLAKLEPDMRRIMISAFGRHGAEAIAIASSCGHILWTDDQFLARFASGQHRVHRVWSQVAIEAAASSGTATIEQFFEASAKLIGWEYAFTSPSPGAFKKAAELAAWNPTETPLKEFLGLLLSPSIDTAGAVSLLLAVLLEIAYSELRRDARLLILDSILNTLLHRLGGKSDVARLPQALRRLSPKDERVEELTKDVETWLASREPLGSQG